jgi:S1-C subfamily serine protease
MFLSLSQRLTSGTGRRLTTLAASLVCLTALSVSQALGGTYERGVRSTVLIRGTRGIGSGVLVDGPRRLVATADHVVRNNLNKDGTISVCFVQTDAAGRLITETSHYDREGARLSIRGRVVAQDERADLALVQLESLPAGAVPAPLASESARPGTKVFVIGHSDIFDGGVFSYCTGYVRNVVRRSSGLRKVLHATPTNRGDSGGPLFNDRDEVIGLVSNGTSGMSADEVRYLARQVYEEAKKGTPAPQTAPRGEPQVRDFAVDVSDIREMLKRVPDAAAAKAPALHTFSGKLAKTDPMDARRAKRHHKVYEVTLKAGRKYVIDLMSGDGQAGAHNPGYFDTYLRVEDAKGNVLGENDDGGQGRNSRLELQPAQDGTYRIIVTSFTEGAVGDFMLEIR